MKGLIIRIIRQMRNDHRSLALLLIAPLMIMTLMYLLLGTSSYEPVIAVDPGFPQSIGTAMKQEPVRMATLIEEKNLDPNVKLPDEAYILRNLSLTLEEDIDARLKNKEMDAFLSIGPNGMTIRMLESDGSKVSAVTDALKSALAKTNPASGTAISFIYGDAKASIFDNLVYALLRVISFFLIFLLSGISFVRERTTGTLERLMLTPIRRYAVVIGYTIGFGIFAVIQSILITLYCHYVLGMKFIGPESNALLTGSAGNIAFFHSLMLAIGIMILLAFAAVATGTLVSIFANNEFQVMQFIPVIIIPQIFFSGIIPIDTLPFHLNNLSYIMPIYYGCSALRDVILKGFVFSQIWGYLAALVIYIILLSVINTFALKKYRKL